MQARIERKRLLRFHRVKTGRMRRDKHQVPAIRGDHVRELRVDAKLKSNEEVLDQFATGRRSQKINRPPLIQTHSWSFEPLLGFLLGPENRCRPCFAAARFQQVERSYCASNQRERLKANCWNLAGVMASVSFPKRAVGMV